MSAFLWALPAIAPYDEVLAQFRQLNTGWAAALAVIGGANLVAPSASQVAALPGLKVLHAVRTDWATSAVTNVVPGGSALAIGLTWSMYRWAGLAPGAIARSIVVTGMWDTFVKLGTPLIAIAWLATQRPVGPSLVQAAVVGTVLFAVAAILLATVLSGPRTASTVGRLIDRLRLAGTGWSDRLDELRSETVTLLAERWRALTFWTVAGHANLYLLLVICVRAVGVERDVLGFAPILAAFAFGRLVSALPITPGGLGVVELGLVSALSAVGGGAESPLVASVLLFRFLSFAVPIPLGGLGLLWWNTKRA